MLAFQAVSSITQDLSPFWRSFTAMGFWAVPVVSISFATFAQKDWTGKWPKVFLVLFTSVLFILYFSKLLMGTVMVIEDLRRGIAWLVGTMFPGTGLSGARLPVMGKFGFYLGLVPLITLSYGLIRNPYRYKVFRKTILLSGLPQKLEGLRIVQISDIHAGSFLSKERVKKSVEMINALKPDLVFFTGDLVNHSADEMDPYIDVFGSITSKHGVWSIVGNHDYGDYKRWQSAHAKKENFEKLKQQHALLGWSLLLNAHSVIKINGSTVAIIGVENYSAHPRFQKYGDLNWAMAGLEKSDLTVLLSHDPSHWDAEVLKHHPGIDLTLSGHTHGFQFGFEFSESIRWSPVQYVYKRWAGLYREGQQYLYVNRGLGFLGYPGRVGILPEITLLTLHNQPAGIVDP
jgi:predicted MPP superfamily phosphohydrolase